jgi:pyrroline-5-carboxylate reductase
MKIAIIGAGNMGGAIARGLARGKMIDTADITVADLSAEKLEALRAACPQIKTTADNQEAVNGAELVLLAVKPWLVAEVLQTLTFTDRQALISIAAGISLDELSTCVPLPIPIFRVVPNTAISEMASMTLIASNSQAPEALRSILLLIFNEMGLAMLIPEKQIPATTALTSCGIAYVLKYVQAAMQAGIELGIYPKDAIKMVAQTMKGAAEILLNNDTHPAIEIDKVTTPGGITIKGINALEDAGFAATIIHAIKASQ